MEYILEVLPLIILIKGFTALDLAIEKNHTNIAELLKEKGKH